jgi:hypothetical protein
VYLCTVFKLYFNILWVWIGILLALPGTLHKVLRALKAFKFYPTALHISRKDDVTRSV